MKNGKNLNSNSDAVIIFDDLELGAMNFVYTNWKSVRTNENKISNVFDWSTARIVLNIGGSGIQPNYGGAPIKPKDFNIVCYGMGRRGSTWKGGRIVLTD